MATQWRGLQAEGKQAEKDKFKYLINNGRVNHTWQSSYLDQQNELVMDRWPYPFIQVHPDDLKELGVAQGDLVEIYNDNGSTQAMVQPSTAVRPKDVHVVCQSARGARQCRLERGERVHYSELQTDLGEYSENRFGSRGSETSLL
jgi:anaerobic selenocysteine-containing dehydrogenase